MTSYFKQEKIGIYGGSFNPVHRGHIAVAKEAFLQAGLSRVFFVPAKDQPFKGMPSASAEDRVAMLRLSIEEHPQFFISLYELQKDGVSYSVETAAYFMEKFPDAALYFILGQDSYDTLPLWRDSERLCKMITPLVVTRTEEDMKHREILLPAIEICMPPVDISSSMIRKSIAQKGVVPEALLCPAVATYIQERGLYRNE